MKHCDNCNNLCLSTESISQMYDKIIDACSDATRLHVPISGKPSPKVIPGWDNDMTAARNSSMFWHDIWVSCNKPESGWVYAVMKKNRNVYHYKLRGFKKLRQPKIKLSVSRDTMTSKNRNYWKSARAVRKNRYNNTPVVDGIHGNSEIANVFKSKFSALYNSSVLTTTETMESLNENI